MTKRAADVLAEALQLSDEEREAITEQLLASLDPPHGDGGRMDDAAWLAELDRRADELRNDPTVGLPWDSVKDMR